MQDGCLGRPLDDDDGRCLVGLDELDGDGVGSVDLARGQFGNLGHGDLASFREWWISWPGGVDSTDRAAYVLTEGQRLTSRFSTCSISSSVQPSMSPATPPLVCR